MGPRLSFLVVLGWLLCGGTAFAGIVIDTVGGLNEQVRQEVSIEDLSMLPESTLTLFSKRAILWTSVDVGGVELQHHFTLVAGQAFYAIPDSITEVLHASYLSGNITKSIKAWYPQFAEDAFDVTGISTDATDEDQIPVVYNYWADTIQLIPAPQQGDSVYLKCFVEHPDAAVGDSICLKPAYTEAAIDYACYLALRSVKMYEDAAIFKAAYDEKKAALRERYTRKFDLFKNE